MQLSMLVVGLVEFFGCGVGGKFGKYGSYFGRAIGCAIVGSVLVDFGVGRDLVDTINWSHSRPKTPVSCLALVVREKTGATKLVWSWVGQKKRSAVGKIFWARVGHEPTLTSARPGFRVRCCR